jgi:hypothetical protein
MYFITGTPEELQEAASILLKSRHAFSRIYNTNNENKRFLFVSSIKTMFFVSASANTEKTYSYQDWIELHKTI